MVTGTTNHGGKKSQVQWNARLTACSCAGAQKHDCHTQDTCSLSAGRAHQDPSSPHDLRVRPARSEKKGARDHQIKIHLYNNVHALKLRREGGVGGGKARLGKVQLSSTQTLLKVSCTMRFPHIMIFTVLPWGRRGKWMDIIKRHLFEIWGGFN